MTFIAKYQYRSDKELVYFRTIDADSLPEADKIARQYARKNYINVTLAQKDNKYA